MIVKRAEFLDTWRGWSNCRLSVADVLQVLPATRIRAIPRSHKSECILNSIRRHLSHCVSKHRMPIAVSPVDGNTGPLHRQLLFQRGDQVAILLIDRTHAAEQVVVFGNLKHSLPWNISP